MLSAAMEISSKVVSSHRQDGNQERAPINSVVLSLTVTFLTFSVHCSVIAKDSVDFSKDPVEPIRVRGKILRSRSLFSWKI